jgi:murein DD-endopeptidase / murein LD-carboxypeptidase
MKQAARQGIICIWCGVAVIMLEGCSPSLRAVSEEPAGAHYYVPPGWDYRDHYRIPSVRLKRIVDSYIGVRYKNGGMSRAGFDCSGFVLTVFRELNMARLPRSTGELKRLGSEIPLADAGIGDLVFFRGGIFNIINHVGIYMGDSTFVHASTTKGVTYDNLNDDYYTKHFTMVRRIF